MSVTHDVSCPACDRKVPVTYDPFEVYGSKNVATKVLTLNKWKKCRAGHYICPECAEKVKVTKP